MLLFVNNQNGLVPFSRYSLGLQVLQKMKVVRQLSIVPKNKISTVKVLLRVISSSFVLQSEADPLSAPFIDFLVLHCSLLFAVSPVECFNVLAAYSCPYA